MIDIHSHILPRIDDGAKNMEESIMMAKLAVQEGIHTIIATPHHKNENYENKKLDIIQKVELLNDVLLSENINLQVLPGQETRIYGEIIEDLEKDEVLTLNNGGEFLFVEFPSGHVPRYSEKLLSDIQFEGITPIIVHPERNQELMENPTLLYNFVKKGSLSQITAASVVGKFGKNIQKFSMKLIESNLTHFIASDAHNIKSRKFNMSAAYQTVEKKFGIDMMDMFLFNTEQLVNDKNIHKEIPERIKKTKFLGLF